MAAAASASRIFYKKIKRPKKWPIKEVWDENLEKEFETIRTALPKYPYIAVDTIHPGIIAKPIEKFCADEYKYQLMRCNVNILKLIQIGFTFMNDKGEILATWQFNFKFNISYDMYASDNMEILKSVGMKFDKHRDKGIEHNKFAELLMQSGIVFLTNVTWMSFHSGYNFGHLMRLLRDTDLPIHGYQFLNVLNIYFPNTYDLKYMIESFSEDTGTLPYHAYNLGVPRAGRKLQAGLNSILTGLLFFKMKQKFFQNTIDIKFSGLMFGLHGCYPRNRISYRFDKKDTK